MRTRYASVPSHDEDAEHELEQAFAISDDEDDDRAHHQNTPLLQHASQGNRQRDEEQETSRTPHTAQSRPVIDGRYNFEYDFPPPGSPPEALAGPNHWGNTNGILVTQPVSPPDVQPTWLTRTWRRVTGRGETVVPSRPIGGGTINDGVFANLSSRPTGSRSTAGGPGAVRNPSEPESSFHAPEIAPDDAPPSYLAAQLDAAPPYWENTVLATTPDEYLIDSIPAGSLFGFVWVRRAAFLLIPNQKFKRIIAKFGPLFYHFRAFLYPYHYNGSASPWHICLALLMLAGMAQKPDWVLPLSNWDYGSENAGKTVMKSRTISGGPLTIKRTQTLSVIYHQIQPFRQFHLR